MKHFATGSFWGQYSKLPNTIQDLARKNFDILEANPRHPSLRLKKVGKYWSARVGLKYRTLGVETDDGVLWFWIGTHAEYDKMLE